MNLRQLDSFVQAAELGSFGAAAKALHCTQSTISSRVRELEASWGVELFDRSHHRAVLTPQGQKILPWAKQILGLETRIRSQLGDAQTLSGVVRVGVAGRISHTWLPRLVMTLSQQYPLIGFDLVQGLTRPLMRMIRAGELDVALLGGPVNDPDLVTTSLGSDEFVWMASPSLRLPRTELTAHDLGELPLVGLSRLSPHYPVIEQWFRDAGADYRPTISCSDMAMAAHLIAAGAGVGLLHHSSHRAQIRSGSLEVLNTQPALPALEFIAVHARDAANPLVQRLVEVAVECSDFTITRP
ncbi:LysR family transcriptional regulator [soil metagenome]